jgi:hypothetical protein
MIVHIVKLHFPAQPSFLTLVWLVPSPIHHAYTIIANPIIANPITNASQFLQCLSLSPAAFAPLIYRQFYCNCLPFIPPRSKLHPALRIQTTQQMWFIRTPKPNPKTCGKEARSWRRRMWLKCMEV